VFSAKKVLGKVDVQAKARLPLQQDLSFIEGLYPELEARHVGTPDIAKDSRVRAYTTWYNLRFEKVELAGGAPSFAPLTKDEFLAAYAKLCYVEIDSQPPGAKLSIVGFNGWNETRETGFLPEGEITIVLRKDGFKDLETKESIKARGKNSFIYTLQSTPPLP
jgi:hypothetical protein